MPRILAALVVVGLIVAGCGGSSDESPAGSTGSDSAQPSATTEVATSTATVEPEVTAAVATSTATVEPAVDSGVTEITITGQNISFDITAFSVPSEAEITVTFQNGDSGVPHNFRVEAGDAGVFRTEIETGPSQQELTFSIAQPGTYAFMCEVHPGAMMGTITVAP